MNTYIVHPQPEFDQISESLLRRYAMAYVASQDTRLRKIDQHHALHVTHGMDVVLAPLFGFADENEFTRFVLNTQQLLEDAGTPIVFAPLPKSHASWNMYKHYDQAYVYTFASALLAAYDVYVAERIAFDQAIRDRIVHNRIKINTVNLPVAQSIDMERAVEVRDEIDDVTVRKVASFDPDVVVLDEV